MQSEYGRPKIPICSENVAKKTFSKFITFPFAETFNADAAISPFSGRYHPLNNFTCFEPFVSPLLIDLEGLKLLTRNVGALHHSLLGRPEGFDIVVHALHAFVALQEFVCLVSVVQMGEIFPFDVETLKCDR